MEVDLCAFSLPWKGDKERALGMSAENVKPQIPDIEN